jgi:hypothetical protein
MARCDVVLVSRVPLRERVPAAQHAMLSTDQLDQPDRQIVRNWSLWRPEDQDVHAWLEYEASKLTGWVPIRPVQIRDQNWRAPSADAALAEDELLTRDQALALLRHLGKPTTMEQWFSDQRTGDIPGPARFVEGRKPRWSRAELTRYALGHTAFTHPSTGDLL